MLDVASPDSLDLGRAVDATLICADARPSLIAFGLAEDVIAVAAVAAIRSILIIRADAVAFVDKLAAAALVVTNLPACAWAVTAKAALAAMSTGGASPATACAVTAKLALAATGLTLCASATAVIAVDAAVGEMVRIRSPSTAGAVALVSALALALKIARGAAVAEIEICKLPLNSSSTVALALAVIATAAPAVVLSRRPAAPVAETAIAALAVVKRRRCISGWAAVAAILTAATIGNCIAPAATDGAVTLADVGTTTTVFAPACPGVPVYVTPLV